jgi:hypothetical protein
MSYDTLKTASYADRIATHERLAAEKASLIEARREIGRAYVERHIGTIVIPPDHAVATASLVQESLPARDEAAALADGREGKHQNGSLEYPVLAHKLAADGPVIRFGTDPLVLAPVVQYLGMMPILFNAFVTRAYQPEIVANSPHHFHLDPEDVRSFKVFVHLTDVDDDCGPFHALHADRSAKVMDAVDYRGITMLDDETVTDLVGWDGVVKVTGPAGTVAFADTTRCLHFGGRPRAAGKPVREMIVYQYLLPTSLLFTGEKAHGARDFFPQLESTGDEVWDTLIGAAHA